jgi:hypothetical protein
MAYIQRRQKYIHVLLNDNSCDHKLMYVTVNKMCTTLLFMYGKNTVEDPLSIYSLVDTCVDSKTGLVNFYQV